MKQFLHFEKFFTPGIIQLLYWVITALVIIAGIFSLADEPVGGIFMIILGPIVVRIYAEFILIMFKIHENLVEIKHNLASLNHASKTTADKHHDAAG